MDSVAGGSDDRVHDGAVLERDGVEVCVLGPIAARRNGDAVDLGLRMNRLLLAALASKRGRSVETETLAEWLWPAERPSRWEASLHSHVSRLRRALGDAGAVETLAGSYRLAVPATAIDAQRFEMMVAGARDAERQGRPAAALEQLNAALALWRGRPYGEFAGEGFAIADVHHLESLHLDVVEHRLTLELARGDNEPVVEEATRLVSAHPLREGPWELLLLALYRSGRQAEALERYQDVRTLLAEELGIEPGPALRQLELAILDHDPALLLAAAGGEHARATPPPPAVPLPAWLARVATSFVGRTRERDLLATAHRRAMRGERVLVVVEGEPGIGKTELVRDLAASLHPDRPLLAGRCSAQSTWPYDPIAEAIVRLVRAGTVEFTTRFEPHLNALVAIAPEIAPMIGRSEIVAPEGEAGRRAATNAFAELVAWVGTNGAPALILDDVQWGDPALWRLVELVLDEERISGLLVVMTCRGGEEPEPLTTLVDRLKASRRADRCVLGGLDPSDLVTLVAAESGLELGGHEIARLTGGNPLYTHELLRHLEESDSADSSLPDSLRETIGLRLMRLDPAVRRVLGIAAVAGARFDPGEIAAVTGETIASTVRALDAAERTGLIATSDGDESFEFRHAIVQQVLLEGLGSTRRAELHRRIASTRGDVEAALHLAAAGDPRTIDVALRAAASAVERRRYDEAVAVLERARAEARTFAAATPPAVMTRLLRALADARCRAGDVRGGIETARVAADAAAAAGDSIAEATALLVEPMWTTALATDWADRAETLLPAVESEPALRAGLLAGCAMTRAREHGARARRFALEASQLLDSIPVANRPTIAAAVATVLDPWDDAEALLERARLVADLAREGNDRDRLVALATLQFAHLSRGEIVEAHAFGAQHETLAAQLGVPWHLAAVEQRRAAFALLHGNFRAAEMHAHAALAHDATPLVLEAFGAQTLAIHLAQGRVAEVAAFADRVSSNESPGWRVGRPLLLLEMGRRDDARRLLHDIGPDGFETLPRDLTWLSTLCTASLSVSRLGEVELAATLSGLLTPMAERVAVLGRGTLCWGPVQRYLARLDCVRGIDPIDRFLAAGRMDEQLGARVFLAEDRLEHAAWLSASGGPAGEIAELERTALALAEEVGIDPGALRRRGIRQAGKPGSRVAG